MTDRPKYHLDAIFDPARAHPDDAHSILMRLVPLGSRVLELGCASGYLSGYLGKNENCRVTGLEVERNATRIASTRWSEVYTVDDTRNALSLVVEPYDVLLAPAVLEHLKDAERLLRGHFDCSDYGVMDRTHLHFYTVRTGRALLENCGYCVQALDIAGSALPNAMNAIARKTRRPLPKPVLPGRLGCELIYQAVQIPQ